MTNKKNTAVYVALFVLLVVLTIFVYNDDFIYSRPILKITEIETVKTEENTNSLNLTEKYYTKKITGVITNTAEKGKTKTVSYRETYSSVVTERYRVGDKIFIEHNCVDELKRDTYIAAMLGLLVFALCLLGHKRGFLIIVSVTVNIFIFLICLQLYLKGINLIFLTVLSSIVFSVLSILVSCGRNKKAFAAICSSAAAVLILSAGLLIIVGVNKYKDVNFNGLSFLTVPPETVFTAELIIGGLGAIMDVCVTMSSSVGELIEKDENISKKALKKSTKNIGRDILNTMINVLFFTFLCASLPVFVLAVRNGFSVYNYIVSNFSLEITRFLLGGISIVMSIPLSSLISIRILKGGGKDE